jgi:hypothetical protein
MIYQCDNPNIGILHDDNHIFFSFDGLVFFSATMKGNAMDCHIGAVGRNKRLLRVAVNQFCEYIFARYSWCDKITACVTMKSVKNLVKKCGFERFFKINDKEVFVLWAQQSQE